MYACGPNFPNNLLDQGDAAVLVAPVTDFIRELERMNLVPSQFQALPAEGRENRAGLASQAAAAEAADLLAAMKKTKPSESELERIRKAHQANRDLLEKFLAQMENFRSASRWLADENGGGWGKPDMPEPKFPEIQIPEGLPGEFTEYLEGALAWHNPAQLDKSAARKAWQRLLERPPAQRHFKSTWAAFMLGKSFEKEDSEKAIGYFKQVRDLARHGFADSVGLAAASLGLEARINFQQEKFETALELYLEQLAAGDPTAAGSLELVTRDAILKGGGTLRHLAANRQTQRVITAYLASHPAPAWSPEAQKRGHEIALLWLRAVEAAGVQELDSAEKLALAAYHYNEIALAQRWIKRAPNSPLTQWLEAKLLLRAGKLGQAAAVLSRVTHFFPIAPPSTNGVAPETLEQNLFFGDEYWAVPAERHILGELGVLRLARREYAQSLDALLNAGFWMDAAYVAENVLTLDELKDYVDRYWPPVPQPQITEEKEKFGPSPCSPALLRENVRYLLARRLTRTLRGDEARDYYPLEWLPSFVALAQELGTGWDESRPAGQRAKALFTAALITRTNGMELLGTEVAPDWHIHGGDFEEGVTPAARATNPAAKVLVVSQDEWRRAAGPSADPELRFHYRYQAAALAWEAARLMPNNSDETARVLWTGGTWLKGRDPETADLFYKALVRRNRKTELGAEADRLHWFPQLDDEGKIIPPKPSRLERLEPRPTREQPEQPPSEGDTLTSPGDYPIPGRLYSLHTGDTLQIVSRAASLIGSPATVQDIMRANPGLNPGQLKVGQKILIPAPTADPPPGSASPQEQMPGGTGEVDPALATAGTPPASEPAIANPTQESTLARTNPQADPENDFQYYQWEIRSGDTLSKIAREVAKAGNPVTLQDLLDANPGIQPSRIQAGQKILIPLREP
jgi:LysM repeat protein